MDIIPHTNTLRMCRTRPSHVVAQPHSSSNPYQGSDVSECSTKPPHYAITCIYNNIINGIAGVYIYLPPPTQCPDQITNPDNRGEECSTSQALCKVSKVQLQVYYQYYLFYSYNRTFGNTSYSMVIIMFFSDLTYRYRCQNIYQRILRYDTSEQTNNKSNRVGRSLARP